MSSRRLLKVGEAIRKVVSAAITTDLRDPRVGLITVTEVEVSGDLRIAKVKVSVLGDEKKQRLSLTGLRNAAGFLQSKIGDRLDMRYIPKLVFEIDTGIKKSLEVARILREVLPETNPPIDEATGLPIAPPLPPVPADEGRDDPANKDFDDEDFDDLDDERLEDGDAGAEDEAEDEAARDGSAESDRAAPRGEGPPAT